MNISNFLSVLDNFWYHISWLRNFYDAKACIEYVQQDSCSGPLTLTQSFASILFKMTSDVILKKKNSMEGADRTPIFN